MALAITVLLNVGMVVWLRRAKNERVRTEFRYALAALLILQEISLNVWRISTGTWTIGESLPLHLCRNYLFICHKPPTPSLIDALGPWPWYVLSLEGVGLAFFVIYYLPFGIGDLIAAQRKRASA